MKRSLGPQKWYPTKVTKPDPPPQHGLVPLCEGPVIGPSRITAKPADSETAEGQGQPTTKIRTYGRGSAQLAEQLAKSDAASCRKHIADNTHASTSQGPYQSRLKTWARIADAAGYGDPFALTPEMIYTFMGAMDKAGYRSAELYLDVAKQSHIGEGRPWTMQLAQASKRAIRACQRGRGPSRQAQPLPLSDVAAVKDEEAPSSQGGPCFPVRSTMLASWWLLREIEASAAEQDHITLDSEAQLVHWRLPSSKADWRALGATRTHTCSCSGDNRSTICPYHCMEEHVKWASTQQTKLLFPSSGGTASTKQGWADTFEAIAKSLNLQTHSPTGARLFTGHSARATGAVHLAQTQIELWRIQLFGRWGSDAFKLYVSQRCPAHTAPRPRARGIVAGILSNSES